MGFKKKLQGEVFKFESKGDSLTGYYLGTQDFEGEYGPGKKHLFKTPNGVKVVFGQSYLTNALTGNDPVAPGTLVRITLDGTKKSKRGQPMKTYDIEVDTDQILDSSEIENNVEAANSEEDDSESFGSPEVEESPVARAVTKGPSSEQIAKINAALRRTAS